MQNFYDEASGVFQNVELKQNFIQVLKPFEEKQHTINIIPDLRFFK